MIGCSLLGACFFSAVRAEETNSTSEATSASGFAAFKVITERNIFNPNRSGRSGRPANSDRPRQVVTDSFGLLGTMIYEKGKFAFFGGSSSDYKKVVTPSDKIAEYTVAEIEPNRVRLEPGGTNAQPIELTVGQQMRRAEGGGWTVSAKREPFEQSSSATSPNAASSTAASAEPSSASAASGGESEILKRLLQKREEELKK
jgi:hypothetical protein